MSDNKECVYQNFSGACLNCGKTPREIELEAKVAELKAENKALSHRLDEHNKVEYSLRNERIGKRILNAEIIRLNSIIKEQNKNDN